MQIQESNLSITSKITVKERRKKKKNNGNYNHVTVIHNRHNKFYCKYFDKELCACIIAIIYVAFFYTFFSLIMLDNFI